MNHSVKGFTNTKIINQQAAEWILLLEDSPVLTQQQINDLNKWVNTSSVHKKCLENMAQSWGEMDLLSEVLLPQEIRQRPKHSLLAARLFYPLLGIYVFFLALIKHKDHWARPPIALTTITAFLTWAIIAYLPQEIDANHLVLQTEMGKNIRHDMSDGSTLWLNGNSTIKIDYTTNYRRITLIDGEAHFEVAKDEQRPFEVYADDRLIRAVGTAFSVYKINDDIEVLVSEGTVELAIVNNTLVVTPDDDQKINVKPQKQENKASLRNLESSTQIKTMLGTLTAGQRITIPVESAELGDVDELDNSEVTRYLSWKEGKLVFAGESLEEVIHEITRYTPIQIDVIDPKLKTMRIGGQFKIGETDTLFYILESGFGISVNKINAHHVQLRIKE